MAVVGNEVEDQWRLAQKLEETACHVHQRIEERALRSENDGVTELRIPLRTHDGGSWRPLTLDLRPDSSLRKESCPPLTLRAFVVFKMDFNFFLLLARPYSCLSF